MFLPYCLQQPLGHKSNVYVCAGLFPCSLFCYINLFIKFIALPFFLLHETFCYSWPFEFLLCILELAFQVTHISSHKTCRDFLFGLCLRIYESVYEDQHLYVIFQFTYKESPFSYLVFLLSFSNTLKFPGRCFRYYLLVLLIYI